jgi:hypothetical protein
VAAVFAGTVWGGSGPWQLDVLECEDFGELVEVCRDGARQRRRARQLPRRSGVPLNIIQRQLGHANLGTTSIYLQGIDTEEIIAAVHTRRAPMMSATAGLRLTT